MGATLRMEGVAMVSLASLVGIICFVPLTLLMGQRYHSFILSFFDSITHFIHTVVQMGPL